jgi:hypothetical protein
MAAASGGQVTLCCVVKSRAGSPVGEPLAIFGDRKISLAALANRLGRWSNTMAEDFVDHFAGRAEIEKVIHYPSASLCQIKVSGYLAHKSRGNCLPHHQQHFAVEAVGLYQKVFLIVVVNDAAIPDDAHPLFLNLHPLAQQLVPPLRHFAFVPHADPDSRAGGMI